jgi:hypothetical protein
VSARIPQLACPGSICIHERQIEPFTIVSLKRDHLVEEMGGLIEEDQLFLFFGDTFSKLIVGLKATEQISLGTV